jgi:hypothetical protein
LRYPSKPRQYVLLDISNAPFEFGGVNIYHRSTIRFFAHKGFQASTNPKSTSSKSTPHEIKLIFRVIDGFNLELQDFFFSYLLKIQKFSMNRRVIFHWPEWRNISWLRLRRFQTKYWCFFISRLISGHPENSISQRISWNSGSPFKKWWCHQSDSCSVDKKA